MAPLAWPPALAGTPAIAVIDQALARQRLGHSLLLHGDSLETLAAVAEGIADRLLNTGAAVTFPVARHPDCHVVRPAGKMRLISADAIRALIKAVQVTATVAARKVVIIYEAEQMNLSAANIFLKTLEEPPANTTLILLTVHPYAILPTLRSRCLHFRFPVDPSAQFLPKEAGWAQWLQDYGAWLGRLPDSANDKAAVADHIFSIYGLIARFGAILDQATADVWTAQQATLPPEMDEDEQIAIETGITKGLRLRFFAAIEEATRTFARERLATGDELARRAFTAAIENLENGARLLRLNLNESAVLEHFLLSSLRLWSKR